MRKLLPDFHSKKIYFGIFGASATIAIGIGASWDRAKQDFNEIIPPSLNWMYREVIGTLFIDLPREAPAPLLCKDQLIELFRTEQETFTKPDLENSQQNREFAAWASTILTAIENPGNAMITRNDAEKLTRFIQNNGLNDSISVDCQKAAQEELFKIPVGPNPVGRPSNIKATGVFVQPMRVGL